MEKRNRNIMVAAALTASALTGELSSAADREGPAIVVHVSDYSGVGSAGLARALAHAQGVFKTAGVRVVWSDAKAGPNARACGGLNLFVILLSPEQMEEQGGREIALGRASRADLQAWIYPGRVSKLAWQRSMDERALLGLAIAHEIGHLVLPGQDHSPTGIMTAGINTEARGMGARFTPQESAAIRALLESKPARSEEPANCGN